ncbi:hypothetical protein O9992_30100 [Vibrio lentus]|nr:hypothetical protein [Vibrio lentus]
MESPVNSTIKLSALCIAIASAFSSPCDGREKPYRTLMKLWCGERVSSNTESIIADDMSLNKLTICRGSSA